MMEAFENQKLALAKAMCDWLVSQREVWRELRYYTALLNGNTNYSDWQNDVLKKGEYVLSYSPYIMYDFKKEDLMLQNPSSLTTSQYSAVKNNSKYNNSINAILNLHPNKINPLFLLESVKAELALASVKHNHDLSVPDSRVRELINRHNISVPVHLLQTPKKNFDLPAMDECPI